MRVRISSTPPTFKGMESFKPRCHRTVGEVMEIANTGYASKVSECILNGDLAQLPDEEAQGILRLAITKARSYSEDMVVPITQPGFEIEYNFRQRQTERLDTLDFHHGPLKDIVKTLYNDG